ncbi:hypothetical protein ACS0TY_022094 [Phlomoides rotata]
MVQPMWDKGDELEKSEVKRFPSFIPVRVSPKVLITNQESSKELETSPNNEYSVEKENIKKVSSFCWSLTNFMEDGSKVLHAPPKDFVCPITTHIFHDPVTLETGQTYERKAIQEWIDRGNSTCPITRQDLHTTHLPRTNYVLKRLIASWQEQSSPAAVSPKSVITTDGTMITELRVAITELCTSEILREAEAGVLRIEGLWKEAKREVEIVRSMLSKPPVINGFVEILLTSLDTQVLRAAVVLLTELGSRDQGVVQALTRVDSDVERIVQLFKNGLVEAVVLLHLLEPSGLSLVEMDLVVYLLGLLASREDGGGVPETAALLLLSRIVRSYADENVVEIVRSIVSSRAIERIMIGLGGEEVEERVAAVSILLRCILEDGKCRNIIVEKVEIAPLLEVFLVVSDGERFEIVHFLSELVKLNRRSLNDKMLHVIKDEGTFSTMHTLVLYLQNASVDEAPIVAGLLLQLDLLDEPRKMSIYREEAMDTLISCLRNSESPIAQICAAETLLSLQGSFSYSGKSLSRALLLKRAGFDRTYKSFMRKDQRRHNISAPQPQHNMEDEGEWEKKVAFVVVSHEFGLVFEALAEGVKSSFKELQSVCFMIAAWLVYMLSILPDTGIRGAARVCLLHHFISIFKSDNNTEERALSMLGLNTFIRDPEGLQDLAGHMKDILKGLRELKKSSAMAFEMLKVFSKEHENSADLWNHKELSQQDCSINGEVLTLACFKGKIFSGHSDGTIKVWIGGEEEQLHLIQQVQEHTKAVTSLAVLHSSDKVYSGSLDRTVRVWTVTEEGIYCEQVEEMKDQINNLVVANSIACYIPQGGGGIKVHSWNGASKLVNQHKYAKCLALVQGRLYCGCQDNSIQEIDLVTGTVGNIQTGSKKLLVKSNPIHALQVHEGLLYAGGPSFDGANVKIWSTSNYGLIGSLQSTLDVRTLAVSSELVYLGCKSGSIEVWCKNKHTRVETLHTSSTAKILCIAFDANQDILLVGTSDGTIQTWGLN